MKKRLLAMLLALMLVVGLLPVGVLADGNESFVNLRLMDQSAWEDATFERAGVDKGIFQVKSIRVYDTDDAYTNAAMLPAGDYYYTAADYEAGSGKVGKLDYNKIDRIVVAFTKNAQTVQAVFHRDEFDVEFVEGKVGTLEPSDRVEVTLKDNLQTPVGPAVWFYAPIGGYTPQTYVLYDVVYLNGASTIGDNMPSLTNVGSTYDLVCWQVGKDGPEFTADTVVNSDIEVYAKKVTSRTDVQHIRAQNNDNLIFEKALEAYNATYGASLTLDAIDVKAVSVYGTNTETNPYYDGVIGFIEGVNSNQWHGNNEYYAIFNINVDVAEVGDNDERCNERVEPDDIQGIKLYAEVNGKEFVCSIPRSELDVRVQNVTWVNIFLREDSEPETGPGPDEPGEELNGTAVTVQVYVDGEAVTNPGTYVDLSRVSADSDSTGWKVALDSDTGVITCDFDYEDGGYDCVDIGVKLTDYALSEGYDLQGVKSYQSFGKVGTSNVTATSDGISYTIDNVTRSNDEQVDVKIYLRSTYVIQYTLDGRTYGGGGSDGLIAGKDIEASTATSEYPATGSSAWMNWTNPNLSSTITLPALPEGDVAGWFDKNDGKHAPNETYTVDPADAVDGIITLNATSTTEPPEPEDPDATTATHRRKPGMERE